MKTDIIQETINNLDKLMIKPYEVYAVAGIKETIQNLDENKMYIFGYELDYVVNKDEIMKAECLGVGEPIKAENGLKLVNIQYIGKIASKGSFASRFNTETNSVDIVDIDSKGKKGLNFDSRISKATKNQLINFHADVKERWPENWKWGYFELENANAMKSKAYHFQKMNHMIFFDFDDDGVIKESYSGKHKYFRITDNVAYDMKRRLFIKNGEEILFYEYNADLKRKLIEKIIIGNGLTVTKEDMVKCLYGCDYSAEKNDKLLDIKRSLIDRDFAQNLGLDKEYLLKNIFICPQNQGYKMIGTFTDDL